MRGESSSYFSILLSFFNILFLVFYDLLCSFDNFWLFFTVFNIWLINFNLILHLFRWDSIFLNNFILNDDFTLNNFLSCRLSRVFITIFLILIQKIIHLNIPFDSWKSVGIDHSGRDTEWRANIDNDISQTVIEIWVKKGWTRDECNKQWINGK